MSLAPNAVQASKRASHIARSLEEDIVRRGWAVGESLGSEQALQQRFRVSRAVLREAVRLVEHHQVARMRRGPGGGLLICEPDAGPATRAVVIYLEYLGITIEDLFDARLVLEPLAASLAADEIDEAGIAALRAVLRAEECWQPGLPVPDDFHIALAECSKNPVLQLFIDVLMRLTRRYALASGADSPATATDVVGQMRCAHAEIAAAVTAGESALAKTLSERHVRAVTTWLHEHGAAKPGSGRASQTLPRRGSLDRLERVTPQGKLAEVLAATIGDDIAAAGWQIGSVFGTETALAQRYRVSRAALREAVRLLEYHAIAQMRRGPGGGLVVTEPQAQASVDTIALYLQYRQPSREDLRCVRDAIEIDNVVKVTEAVKKAATRHGGSSEILDKLRAPLQSGTEAASTDIATAAVEESRFHIGLAQSAGNALLELFLRIIIELFRRHWSSTGQLMPTRTDLLSVDHAHQRILEAIEDGDDSLARHRLRRHLDAAASWWF